MKPVLFGKTWKKCGGLRKKRQVVFPRRLFVCLEKGICVLSIPTRLLQLNSSTEVLAFTIASSYVIFAYYTHLHYLDFFYLSLIYDDAQDYSSTEYTFCLYGLKTALSWPGGYHLHHALRCWWILIVWRKFIQRTDNAYNFISDEDESAIRPLS